MHQYITYDKKTGQITGYFVSSTDEFLPKPPSPNEENLEVTDPKQIELVRDMNPHAMRLRGTVDSGSVRTLKTEPIFRGRIELSCDLPDRDGDGLPELPADGQAVARIKATLRGSRNRVLSKEAATIRFQVDRGLLSHRRVDAKKGVAQVELRSVPETVRLRVLATAEGFQRATLDLETIPVEEYRELAEAIEAKAE